jgi:hypothetical protein
MIRQTSSTPGWLLLASLLVTLGLGGCATGGPATDGGMQTAAWQNQAGAQPAPAIDAAQSVSQQQVLEAQAARARKVEVTVGAYVKKLLPPDTQGLPHQRFLIGLNNDTTVLVAHDTAMAPPVPLRQGDFVVIHGEYIWNEKGGVLHWTHHTDTPRHEGGWIDYAGRRYQ